MSPSAPAFDFDETVAGMTRAEKIKAVMDSMAKIVSEKQSLQLLITDPSILCWLLNIRGRDLDHTPFLLAFGVLEADGTIAIYADKARLSDISPQQVKQRDPSMLIADLTASKGTMLVDPATCPMALFQAIGAEKIEAENPAVIMKARKTKQEINAIKSVHLVDAVAMIRFLHWFDTTIQEQPIREVDVDKMLIKFRSASTDFICPSFATICGGGGNGAIVHYRAIEGQDQEIPRNSLCLIDSGGQYRTATTDITRTVATGTPPEEMAIAFTHVLQSHIALATAIFPEGTNGIQLDAITRAPLWLSGRDYAHGTGHGVGCCLSVHEGPASISKRSSREIEAGMVLSNEPGFYVSGSYGIRIENLVHVQTSGDNNMLSLETISLVPIDKRLIITDLLTSAECAWVDAYHNRVKEEIGPLVAALDDQGVMAWFDEAVAPLIIPGR